MSYNYTTGAKQILTQTVVQTANIIAYDPTTKAIVLDTPINVSLGYNAVAGAVKSQYSIKGSSLNVSQAIQNGNLPTMATDEAGNFTGIFNVPPGKFQTGSRVFRVDNRTVLTDSSTATCYAEATFTASGLSTTAQHLDFAPSVDASSQTFTSVAQTPNQLISTITTYTPYDPIAQSFLLNKSNYPNGAFLKSIKVFFANKPQSGNFPVTLSVVPTINGYPSGQALSYSTVSLQGNQIVTSLSPHYLDSSTYTEFMFDAPVYIQPGVLYAFILKASSPEYQVYYAQQNQIAVASTSRALPTDPIPTQTTKVGSAPYVGALFESQNSITWTADQTKNMMFVIDNCVFDISQQPQVEFNLLQGLPYRKLGKNDINHRLDAATVPNIYGNLSSLTGLAANTGATQIEKLIRSDAINLTTTDFVPTSTAIDYDYVSTLANGQTPIGPFPVTPGKYGSPTSDNIFLGDGQGERLLVPYTNSSFIMHATMSSNDANVSPIISDDGVSLYNIRYIINNMSIGNNVISLVNGGSGYLSNTNGVIYSGTPNAAILISQPDDGILGTQAQLGANVANGVITSVWVTNPGAGYITTPTVTIAGTNTSPAIINVTGETSPHGGNALTRYFTKKVVLNAGQDSGDLRVFYTAYKPIGSQVYVYYKILSSNDSQKFDDGGWNIMTQISTNAYSLDRTNLIEFECAPGVWSSGNGAANNQVSYTSSNGNTYNNFIQFAIKVVLAASDNTNPPTLTDIRALALPPGTGI